MQTRDGAPLWRGAPSICSITINTHANLFPMPPLYRRHGKAAFLDPIRSVLVEDKPEEAVRQAFLHELIERYGVPKSAIRVEYALSKLGVRSRARADIVIVGEGERVLMVVECKEPGTPLHDGVREQAMGYAHALVAPFVALVNGVDLKVMHHRDGDWQDTVSFPSFEQLCHENGLRYMAPEPRTRPALTTEELQSHSFLRMHDHERARTGWAPILGEDTPAELWPAVYALCSAISYEPNVEELLPYEHARFRVEKYLGNHFLEFGNYSGGRFPGFYASFLIRDLNGDNQIFRIGFFNTLASTDHPKYGTRKGTSGLHVVIDDFDSAPHPSIELCLDRFILEAQGGYELVHDGRITVGRLGAAKRDAMLGYVQELAPDLIREHIVKGQTRSEVLLGRFPKGRALSFGDIAPLVFNLLRYAEMRDRFREDYKRQHAARPSTRTVKRARKQTTRRKARRA